MLNYEILACCTILSSRNDVPNDKIDDITQLRDSHYSFAIEPTLLKFYATFSSKQLLELLTHSKVLPLRSPNREDFPSMASI